MSPIPPPTPVTPETHLIPPTQHSPNSALPIIVYRQVLTDTSPSAILSTIEPNGWLKGGQFKASPASKVPHFHSVCHECYGIIRGRSTYLLGKSPVDEDVDGLGRKLGLELRVEKGDVFVLPVSLRSGVMSRCASGRLLEIRGRRELEDARHDRY